MKGTEDTEDEGEAHIFKTIRVRESVNSEAVNIKSLRQVCVNLLFLGKI